MNPSEARLARVAYHTLQGYVLALMLVWFWFDHFCHWSVTKIYQQTYVVIVDGGGGPFAVALLFAASFFFWRVRRRAAIAGFTICLLWAAYAALPRL
jgi:hypothetical protein